MKYRIIQDSDWEYIVQWKYKLRPFWINNYGMTERWDYYIAHKTFEEAEEELNNIIKSHSYRECVKIVKEITTLS